MKTIMLSDEAYNKLASIKGKRSFTKLVSELVDRLKGSKFEDIDMFFGIIDNEEAAELKSIVKKVRKRTRVVV